MKCARLRVSARLSRTAPTGGGESSGFGRLPSDILSCIFSFGDCRAYAKLQRTCRTVKRAAELASSSPHKIQNRWGGAILDHVWKRLRPRYLGICISSAGDADFRHMRELRRLSLNMQRENDPAPSIESCNAALQSLFTLEDLTHLCLEDVPYPHCALNLCAPMLTHLDLSALEVGQALALPQGLESLEFEKHANSEASYAADYTAIGRLPRLIHLRCDSGDVPIQFWDALLSDERERPAVLKQFCAPTSRLRFALSDADVGRAAAFANLPLRHLEFFNALPDEDAPPDRRLAAFVWGAVAQCRSLETLWLNGDDADDLKYGDDIEWGVGFEEKDTSMCARLGKLAASVIDPDDPASLTAGHSYDEEYNGETRDRSAQSRKFYAQVFEGRMLGSRWMREAFDSSKRRIVRGKKKLVARDLEDAYMRKYDKNARKIRLLIDRSASMSEQDRKTPDAAESASAEDFIYSRNPLRFCLSTVCTLGLRNLCFKGDLFENDAHLAALLSGHAPQLISLEASGTNLLMLPDLTLGPNMPRLQSLTLRRCSMRRGLISLAKLTALTDLDLHESSGVDDLSLLTDRCPLVRDLRLSSRSKDPDLTLSTIVNHPELRDLQGFVCCLDRKKSLPTLREAADVVCKKLVALPAHVAVSDVTLSSDDTSQHFELRCMAWELNKLLTTLRTPTLEPRERLAFQERERYMFA